MFRLSGFDIIKYPDRILGKRIDLIRKYKIGLIIDVGAGSGGFGRVMRSAGYKGDIISFEPLKESFNALQRNSRKDKRWEAINCAIGDKNGEAYLNVAGNYDSSSILPMSDKHVASSPSSRNIRTDKIVVRELDSFLDYFNRDSKGILLKIDTQGYEEMVLKGATRSLPIIRGIQVEMSFVELYEGQMLFDEMKSTLEKLGFTLCLLEPGFISPLSGKLLQVDGTFYRI
jgi:FkbM family methyltransferase